MIRANELCTGLEVSIPVVKALLAFASRDKTRANMHGVGISGGTLAATDGKAAVVFNTGIGPGYDGMIWPLPYVQTQLKYAQVTKDLVTLSFVQLDASAFPSVNSIVPAKPLITASEENPPSFHCAYLALLEAVAVACTQPKDSKQTPKTPPATIRNLGGSLEVMALTIGDNSGRFAHYATVLINSERS